MKSEFLTPLIVEKMEGADWRLAADLVYQSARLGGLITVPKGFVTDFASVPRMPLAFWLVGDTAHKPATVHDWLYRSCIPTRRNADFFLHEGMEATGEPAWRCAAVYRAVRTFGGMHYCKTNPSNSGVGNTRALGLAQPRAVPEHLIKELSSGYPGSRGYAVHPTLKEILK